MHHVGVEVGPRCQQVVGGLSCAMLLYKMDPGCQKVFGGLSEGVWQIVRRCLLDCQKVFVGLS